MNWSSVIGQERVKRALHSAYRSDRLPHAYLFHGPAGTGKDAAAIALARSLNCEQNTWGGCGTCDSCRQFDTLRHPRFKLVFALPSKPEESTAVDKFSDAELRELNEQIDAKAANPYHVFNMSKASGIKISSIRDIRKEAAFRAAGHGRTVVLISEAHRMNASASNALLKTLEEPGGDLLLILTTSKRDALLPTIISRCQQVRFDPLTDDEISAALMQELDIAEETARTAAQLAGGSFTHALAIAQEGLLIPREEIRQYLRAVVRNNPDELMEKIRAYTEFDPRTLTTFLCGVQNWFRDVLAVHIGATHLVRSIDLKDKIESFSAHYPDARCDRAIDAIEESIALIPRNVNQHLMMVVLSNRLRLCIVGEN